VLNFWLCFVPLFVAVDAIGLLPVFISLTDGFSAPERRRIIVESVITAMAVAVGFLFVGQWVFQLLGITTADFMIAGGVLLFVFAMSDLFVTPEAQRRVDAQSVGAVPLGVPLTVGPAVLATILLLAAQYGRLLTVASVVANITLAGLVFSLAPSLNRVLGRTGTRAISKIMSLVLAAIAVKMVRMGVIEIIHQATIG
jgi:multiple antibiotic resistance protein